MPKDTSGRRADGAVITHTSSEYGNRPPFFTLPIWLLGLATPQELAVLAALQAHYPDIRPGVARVAEKAGVSESTARRTFISLEAKGWLKRQHRTSPIHGALPTRYLLRIWDLPQPPLAIQPPTPRPVPEPPQSARKGPPMQADSGPPITLTGELDQEQLDQEQEEIPPPSLRSVTPPRGGSAPEGQDQQQLEQPQQPQQPDPLPQPPAEQPPPRKRKPRPSPDDSLVELPVFAESERPLLAAWWRLRCREHPRQPRDGLTRSSANALAYAHELGVLHEFCLQASERPWISLGFNGYRGHLERLAADLAGHAGSDTLRPYNSNRNRPINKFQEGLNDFLAVYGSQAVEETCSQTTISALSSSH